MLKKIFWSIEQGRLRTPFRVALFVVIFGVLVRGLATLVELYEFGEEGAFLAAPLTNGVVAVAIIVALFISGRFLDRRSMSDWGLGLSGKWWADLIAGLLIPALVMTPVFLILLSQGWIEITGRNVMAYAGFGFAGALTIQTARYLAGSIMEEAIFRAYLLRTLSEVVGARWIGKRAAVLLVVVLTSAAFGAMHLSNPNATLVGAANLTLLGIVFGLPMAMTGRLALSIGLHMSWNIMQNVIFGLANSGQEASVAILAAQPVANEAWTGGAFGIEGGLAGTVAALAALVLTLIWIWRTNGGLALHAPLATAPERT